MIRQNLKILIVTSVVTILPIFAGVILWNQLPQQLPIHWNASGEVDGWCTKPFAVFGMPLIFAAVHWLSMLVTLNDPKKQNHSEKILNLIFWIVPMLSIGISALTYAVGMGKSVQVGTVVSIFSGLLFVIIGNYLPKCKQNYTIGIKLPWTLSSEDNWNKTHRLTGRIWVICGLAMILIGFFGSILLTLGIALVMGLVPFVYSYVLHRKGV